jgi:predicted GIY-YIG superfamily endonuclease
MNVNRIANKTIQLVTPKMHKTRRDASAAELTIKTINREQLTEKINRTSILIHDRHPNLTSSPFSPRTSRLR